MNWMMSSKLGYVVPAILGLSILSLVSVCLWLRQGAFDHERSRNCKLISAAISFAPGTITTLPFRVNVSANYILDVEFQGNFDLKKMQCQLGIMETEKWDRDSQARYARQCKDIPDVIDISWELMEGGRPAEIVPGVFYKGDSHEHPSLSWADGISARRQIGILELQKNRDYSLRLQIKRDASELDSLNPTIIVTKPSGVDGCTGFELTESQEATPSQYSADIGRVGAGLFKHLISTRLG